MPDHDPSTLARVLAVSPVRNRDDRHSDSLREDVQPVEGVGSISAEVIEYHRQHCSRLRTSIPGEMVFRNGQWFFESAYIPNYLAGETLSVKTKKL